MSRLPFDDDSAKVPRVVPEVPAGSKGLVPEVRKVPEVPKAAAPARTILTVSELNATIRDLLENELQNVWVEGEISNARVWNTGHMYFTLKDGASQIKAVMFRSAVRYLKFKPEDGLKVVARGKISVYDPKGEYQILCEHMEPKGLGSLQQAFEQLKKKLAAEGLFDPARKRPLPALPRRIGIVTSLDGAALRDMIRVLRRRYPNAHLVISPTRVQGEGAGREVAHAIRKVARIEAVDVIIVARGGGSLEDLWAFNEEVLARAIVASPVPVISGVGHETDFTICDFVADLRAPTPSAAAEIVIRAKSEICTQVDTMVRRVRNVVETRVRNYRHELRHLASSDRLGIVVRRVAITRDRLERRRVSLYRLLDARAKTLRRRLDAATEPLALYPARIERERQRLRATMATLQAVSPLSVLSRGYAIAFSRTRRGRKPIQDSSQVKVGEQIEVQLKRGRLEATVDRHTLGVESLWPEIQEK